jgi:phenylacetate-CoA ligase
MAHLEPTACETIQATDALAEKVAAAFQAECKVRPTVEFVASGELPNDGKTIDDIRQYD